MEVKTIGFSGTVDGDIDEILGVGADHGMHVREQRIETDEYLVASQIVYFAVNRVVCHARNIHCVKHTHRGFKIPDGLVVVIQHRSEQVDIACVVIVSE